MINKLFFLLVTALMCLVLAGAASAVTNSEPANPDTVVTGHSAVDGHKVVYAQRYSDTDYDIYITDLTTKTVSPVSSSTNYEINPDISGNIVVWQGKATGGKWQIYWKDISSTNPAALVHGDPSYDQENPSISGNYVVWQQYWGGADADTNNEYADYDIKGYDLATNTYYGNIASTKQYEGNPDISGNTVVYQKYVNVGTAGSPKWRMQVYKTTFGTINQGTRIHPNTYNQLYPSISGKKVVWQGKTNTNSWDIWCQNLATNTGFWVTQTTDYEEFPAISGNIAVWEKWKNTGGSDIVMQDISSSSNPKKSVAKGTSTNIESAVGVDQYGIFVSFTQITNSPGRVYWRNMDATPPKPTAGSPARNAVNVAVGTTICTTFSEPVKLGAGLIKLVSSTGTSVNINKWCNGKILYVRPVGSLKKATKYTLILAAGSVVDYAGNPNAAYSRSFTTDSTPPTPIAGTPSRNAVNVPRNTVITTTFNEGIAGGNLWITLKPVGGTPVTITPGFAGNVLHIFHGQLAPSTKYILELHTGCITDLAGNPLKYYYRYFTTGTT